MKYAVMAFFLLNGIPAQAQQQDLIAACTPDAKRICSYVQLAEAAVGGYQGIKNCFRHHKSELSSSCRSMITKYGYR